EILRYHFEFEHHFAESVKVNYLATLADDQGKVVATVKAPGAIVAARGARPASAGLATPILAEGVYHLSVTTSALGRSSQGSSSAELYLEVASGRISEIDEEDWFKRSRARAPVELGAASAPPPPDAGARGAQ